MIISLKDRSFQQNPQSKDTGYEMDNRLPKLRESTDMIRYFPKNEYPCFLNAWKWQLLPNVFSSEISRNDANDSHNYNFCRKFILSYFKGILQNAHNIAELL